MGDVAALAVGLHLNAANFKSQLMSAYGDADNQSRRFNRNAQADAKKTEDAYRRVSDSVTGLAGRLAGFAGAGLSLGAIINTTRQYSQSLSDLQAITGATSAQMKLYDQAAQEMGRTTEYSASQAAEAIKLMASAKPELLSTSEGLSAATKSALTLAQAAGTTLPDATRTLALSLNQFGAGAEQADRYINVLAAGAKYGSSEIVDTAAAIKNGGVAAAQAGVGFEQLNAAIQVLAAREIKGGEAGTALRNVILNLEKGADKSLKPSVVGLSRALANLAGKNLSTAQAVKLFGVENITAASILVDNRSKLDELTTALTGTQTAHEQAAIRVNNLNGDLMGLTSAFEGLILKVGQSGDGPLRSGVQTITEALNGLADNFNTVANVALYTLVPVLSTKLTAGVRGSISAWRENQAAVKAAAQAQADIARKTLESTSAILAQNNAEFGHYREMEKKAKLYGLNVSYQSDFNRLIRQETEQTLLATQAKYQLNIANKQLSISARAASVAIGLAKGALALVGGPFGAAMLAGSALLYFHQQAKDARQSAINLKDAVVETSEALKTLSLNQLNVKQLDLDEQYQNQIIQRNKIIKEIQDADSRIDNLSSFDPFGQLKGVRAEQTRARGNLDAVEAGLRKLEESKKNVREAIELAKSGKPVKPQESGNSGEGKNSSENTNSHNPFGGSGVIDNSKKIKVDQYLQLRQQIEDAHATSLGRINLQEQESSRKLAEAAKKNGVSDADLQKTLLLNAENYQKQRLELAEQYAPARASLTKEREASQELKSLLDARLLDEKEYQAARVSLTQNTARELLQAQAAAMSAPLIDIAGTVDPLAELRNQLAERQSLLQAYYQNDAINKEQYELLKQKAAKDSADSQYQTAVELYRSQGDLNNLSIGLFETAQERTSNMLTGLLMNTQSFRDGMVSMFASLAQSVIKNLTDMAAQALLTNTILKSIMGIGSGISGGLGESTGTAISNFGSSFSFNAKGGVYDSPSLSSFSNGIYNTPTLFAFAKGAGVFGEAGPEAIMPLSRTADGVLGVRALRDADASSRDGRASQMVYSPVYNIAIQNDGKNGEIGPQAARNLIQMIDSRVQITMQSMRRDGGMLSG
ncbi:phage tail tape measure protein [Salmonella enterica subsp. enterica serovar Thompson]|uniref:Phage tail tape measure protein n=1 Tax=Salmonella enterica TaxID=28901 RepID=A0A5V1W8M4_SALER|nr:phage tail tape measure protein [Salmonella enterica]EAO6001885.1 phage tail tape measure protein [Salmonella enterica subsp. arizonae serovar 62:z36:-]ECG1414301.1 phage tail tape measure protein [Salmonella enterica subsp. arizonae str. CFSAN000560]ECU2046803.1 phage tail tape measure protein [Salmonella enterica subsp. enterica serovar Thompson]EDK1612249.1 phage tail tape measure protein [Salmonella enterica subsp. enterica serovar Bareilly]EDQ6236557.1 phage tail tape measure protein [